MIQGLKALRLQGVSGFYGFLGLVGFTWGSWHFRAWESDGVWRQVRRFGHQGFQLPESLLATSGFRWFRAV